MHDMLILFFKNLHKIKGFFNLKKKVIIIIKILEDKNKKENYQTLMTLI